jgi:hypothetical protein
MIVVTPDGRVGRKRDEARGSRADRVSAGRHLYNVAVDDRSLHSAYTPAIVGV